MQKHTKGSRNVLHNFLINLINLFSLPHFITNLSSKNIQEHLTRWLGFQQSLPNHTLPGTFFISSSRYRVFAKIACTISYPKHGGGKTFSSPPLMAECHLKVIQSRPFLNLVPPPPPTENEPHLPLASSSSKGLESTLKDTSPEDGSCNIWREVGSILHATYSENWRNSNPPKKRTISWALFRNWAIPSERPPRLAKNCILLGVRGCCGQRNESLRVLIQVF
jgi:hypothetical protein